MSAKMNLTISKALVRSIALVNVREGEQGWLKPRVTLCAIDERTDTVEWLEWKPY